MLKSYEAIFENGQITWLDEQPGINAAKIIVTVLADMTTAEMPSITDQSINQNIVKSLRPSVPCRDRYEIDEAGWPVLKRQPGDTTVITNDFINQLREEEGI